VLGRGNRQAPLLLVGEGPGEQEDIEGKPFVGQAGQLLDLLLDALGFTPDDYYIANVVKCRPPGNREPTVEEAACCLPYLREQFKLLKPRLIVCMGSVASRSLLDPAIRITQARGQWQEKKGCLFMPTFHPAALLRDPSKKIPMYSDMLAVKEKLAVLLKEETQESHAG
jgi:DNA polymerase